jgi:surface carbohydrate biosynthesis protein
VVSVWAGLRKKYHTVKRVVKLLLEAEKTFRQPKAAQVLVIDAEGADTLFQLFGEFSYEVLHLRNERVNLNGALWLDAAIGWLRTKNLKLSYADAYLKIVNPSVAITFVDNSQVFQMLDKKLHGPKLKFMAIQNGRRALARDNPIGGVPIFHSNFFCFGQHEVDQYKAHGAEVIEFHPCGSLKDSYYREIAGESESKSCCDVVLISEGWYDTVYDSKYGAAKTSFDLLCTHLKRYIKEHKINVVVACRNEQREPAYERELNDLKRILGADVTYISNIRNNFVSYRLTDSSNVVLGAASTLILEAFGRGRKVLSINYSGDSNYDFPVDGFWSLSNSGYDEFSKALTYLLTMTASDYKNKAKIEMNYAINYSCQTPMPRALKNFIDKQMTATSDC